MNGLSPLFHIGRNWRVWCLGAGVVLGLAVGVAEAQEEGPRALEPVPPDAVLEAEGAVIGEVWIERLNIFDPTDPDESGGFYSAANALHMVTRRSTIRAQLLFRSGEKYSRRVLDESERILRDNEYLWDAWIEPVRYENGVVDIRVTTRDVWTIEPGISISRSGGENRTGIEVVDQNFLGRGGELSVGRKEDEDRTSTILGYRDKNLGASWLSLGLTYIDSSDGETRGISLARPFFSLDTRWSAGGAVLDDDRVDSVYELGDKVGEYRHETSYVNAFYGWSAGLRDGWVTRWRAGVVYDDESFEQDPGGKISPFIPEDRKLVYPYVTFELIEDKFFETRNLDQMARTEDVYLGRRASVTLGWSGESYGADRDALVFRGRVGRGYGDPASQFLALAAEVSGRLDSEDLANTVLSGQARYYLHQSEKRTFFAGLSVDGGRSLDLDNPMEIGGDTGLRGYPLRYQRGESRMLTTLEQRFYTDIYLFRIFRVGGAFFYDMGRTWGDNPAGEGSLGWLRDAGFGLRLANTRTSIGKVIHIDVAFPLDGDDDIDSFQILLEGKRSF